MRKKQRELWEQAKNEDYLFHLENLVESVQQGVVTFHFVYNIVIVVEDFRSLRIALDANNDDNAISSFYAIEKEWADAHEGGSLREYNENLEGDVNGNLKLMKVSTHTADNTRYLFALIKTLS